MSIPCTDRGFTLIEMLIVIVISSIIAVTSVQFIVFSMQGVADTSSRQKTAFSASLMAERLSREVRSALPNSVRLFSRGGLTNNCVEFIPVLAASRYLEPLAGVSLTAWDVVSPGNVDPSGSVTGYVSVYPVSEDVVYPNGNDTAVSQNTVTFAAGDVVSVAMGGHTFPTDSPLRRFFVTGQPVSFCGESSGYVFRYSNYGFDSSAGSSVASGTRQTFINGLSSLIFSYSPATLTRNGVLTFRMVFDNSIGDSEPLTLNQQVQVRNVP